MFTARVQRPALVSKILEYGFPCTYMSEAFATENQNRSEAAVTVQLYTKKTIYSFLIENHPFKILRITKARTSEKGFFGYKD